MWKKSKKRQTRTATFCCFTFCFFCLIKLCWLLVSMAGAPDIRLAIDPNGPKTRNSHTTKFNKQVKLQWQKTPHTTRLALQHLPWVAWRLLQGGTTVMKSEQNRARPTKKNHTAWLKSGLTRQKRHWRSSGQTHGHETAAHELLRHRAPTTTLELKSKWRSKICLLYTSPSPRDA